VPHDRTHPQIERRREAQVQAQLFAAEQLPPRQRREIKERNLTGRLILSA
jgi:hypothetical protein